MKTISEKMIAILERLSEMFPHQTYQAKLDAYLSKHYIDNTAQLERLVRRFEQNHERGLI